MGQTKVATHELSITQTYCYNVWVMFVFQLIKVLIDSRHYVDFNIYSGSLNYTWAD